MGRGRGKGKGRGGGRRMFIANEDELALRDRSVAERVKQRENRRGEDDDDDDDEDETNDADDSGITFERTPALSEAVNEVAQELEQDERPKGLLAGVSGVANPNAVNKTTKQLKVKDMKDAGDVDPNAGLSRREREVLEAERQKADYLKRHLAGETEQAKKEMAQLALVRQRREEAKKKREAEGRKPGMSKYGLDDKEEEESEDEGESSEEETKPKTGAAAATAVAAAAAAATSAKVAEAKRKAAAGESTGSIAADGGPPILKSMEIKKMNPEALKDHLKQRGLSIQGQKKDLSKRLLDYETARV
mmetsp:Transcript_14329/g.14432  ORF Transcript_14329/g.14432 Transcript_14329/m.14432 type:complete len:305 (-) Transcript_14329:58-972(-)|eukprot:CAMPEP_0182417948 /NCGR_PEP_ID=MMETSP1167-20130531/2408_1 /TAXON_ID=2988 /ORGANISM="Mallomonas Sp, Strain CCMP3275" /LENGTH=304 /DNA_ID=CAMNT_0024591857 /DNA_START=170 /DNA_END=1084 /DNA_ORIENTATION=+